MANGIAQKNNLSNGTIFASSMVGGLFIPQAQSPEHAQLVFIDPEPHPTLKLLQQMDPQKIVREVRRQSFAKALATAGLWVTAGGVSSGKVGSSETGFARKLDEGELRFNGFFRTEEDTWQRNVEYRSLESDAKGNAARIPFKTRLIIEVSAEIVSRLKEFTSESGAVGLSEIDAWLAERLSTQRTTTKRTIHAQRQPSGRFSVKRNSVSSSWTMSSSKDDNVESASVMVSSGMKLTLERVRFVQA